MGFCVDVVFGSFQETPDSMSRESDNRSRLFCKEALRVAALCTLRSRQQGVTPAAPGPPGLGRLGRRLTASSHTVTDFPLLTPQRCSLTSLSPREGNAQALRTGLCCSHPFVLTKLCFRARSTLLQPGPRPAQRRHREQDRGDARESSAVLLQARVPARGQQQRHLPAEPRGRVPVGRADARVPG